MKALVPRLAASVCWAAVVIGGLFFVENLPTSLNIILFALPSLAFGYCAGRWWPLAVPWLVAIALSVISFGAPCDPALTADGCGDHTAIFALIVFFAPLAMAEIAVGVIGRKVARTRVGLHLPRFQ